MSEPTHVEHIRTVIDAPRILMVRLCHLIVASLFYGPESLVVALHCTHVALEDLQWCVVAMITRQYGGGRLQRRRQKEGVDVFGAYAMKAEQGSML